MYLIPFPTVLAFYLFSLLSPVSSLSTHTSRNHGGKPSSEFVTVSEKGNAFSVHAKDFTFVGANAYWLPYLNSDDDVRNTLANMSKAGITVVRTWAFNDVTTVPDNGSWLLLIQNGNTTVNRGANGIQRLDKIIKFAKEYNIYVYFSLTNNWFPTINAPPPSNDSSSLPRNFLSNHYGGMDVYVQEFGAKKTHDEFYTNKRVRNAFNKYVRFIVSRYANESGIIAWELANDARCSSTLPSCDSCNTHTLTRWHAETAKFIRSIDCNHLITSGVHGFLCPTCPKLFPPPPPPKHSPTPGSPRKRTADGYIPPWELVKRTVKSRVTSARDGMTIRGLWSAPTKTRRQIDGGSGLSAFNGAFGVDGQDILNAPDIDFGTFQLFPDSVNYGSKGAAIDVQPPSRQFGKTFNDSVDWINSQVYSARVIGKPMVLSAFGIVTRDNLPFFVPVNETAPVVISPANPKGRKRQDSNGSFGVDQSQVNTAYSTWAGVNGGVAGSTVYQWTSQDVQPGAGSPVLPNPNTGGTSSTTPNDGLPISGPDEANVLQILKNAATTAAQNPPSR